MPDLSAPITLNVPLMKDKPKRAGRLILDEPARGSWNMAVDAAILESIQPDDPPTLRFYRWSKPTLSLGYFQASDDRSRHASSQGIDWLRRSTGGGAIVHDRELTYSLVLPQAEGSHGADHSIYDTVHQAVINALQTIGIKATRSGSMSKAFDPIEPFLCFQRRTDQDLIVSGYKVLGSAQRRGAKGILQHGSLLICASQAAPELPGLLNLDGRLQTQGILQTEDKEGTKRECADPNLTELATLAAMPSANIELATKYESICGKLMTGIAAEIATTWRIDWSVERLRQGEKERAQTIEENRFTQPLWNFKR